MSHPEQIGFLTLVRDHLLARPQSVIEIGSYDVNEGTGGIRRIFPAPEYVGVDLAPGPGVDVVMSGHEVDRASDSVDLAVSSECFEHNPYWAETFENMHRMTRKGGLVVMTCATRGRVEHGTARTDPSYSPGTSGVGWNYYRNLAREDFDARFDLARMFSHWRFFVGRSSHDLYFFGFKHGAEPPAYDRAAFDRAVGELGRLRPRDARYVARAAVRAPLALLSKLLPERAFQAVAVPYSNAIYGLCRRVGISI